MTRPAAEGDGELREALDSLVREYAATPFLSDAERAAWVPGRLLPVVDALCAERAAEAVEDAAAWFIADLDVPVRIAAELHERAEQLRARAAALAEDGR